MSLHPGTDKNCTTCKGAGYLVSRKGEHAYAKVCTCVSSCPICRGTSWVTEDNGGVKAKKRCSCTELDRRIQLFSQARIPGRHAHSTRTPDSFKPTYEVMPALAAVSRYLQTYRNGTENRGLIMYGDVGRGKTHLLIAMLRDLIFEHGVSVRFTEFSHLLADLKSSFDRGFGASNILDPLVKVDVLAIDELGKGRNTEFEGTVLDELVSRRYNAGSTILATTNFSPGASSGRAVGDLSTGQIPALIDRIGPRVYSRLREMCDFCEVNGDDYREKVWSDRQSSGSPKSM